MRKVAGYVLMAILVLTARHVHADKQSEIEHLLAYVEKSGCEFERNGDIFDAPEARENIQRKYDYVMRWGSSRIKTAEDFIRLTASESSLSGNKYYVNCNGKSQTSSEWLLEELARFRAKNS